MSEHNAKRTLGNYTLSACCRLKMDVQSMDVQSDQPINKSLGFLTKILCLILLVGRLEAYLVGQIILTDQIRQFQLVCQRLIVFVSDHSTMERQILLVGRLNKSVKPTNLFFYVPLVSSIFLVSMISQRDNPPICCLVSDFGQQWGLF